MPMLKLGVVERYHAELSRLSTNNEGKIGGRGPLNTWERHTTFHQPVILLRGKSKGSTWLATPVQGREGGREIPVIHSRVPFALPIGANTRPDFTAISNANDLKDLL
jgi:hypothetical protein